MSVRFDEVELLKEPELPSPEVATATIPILEVPAAIPAPNPERPQISRHEASLPGASRFHRAMTFLTDLSLFIALALALSPLLPYHADWAMTLRQEWPIVIALGGFLLLLSYYYFVTSWLIWGKTVGGAIFDVRVVSDGGMAMTGRSLSRRWIAMLLSILLGGTGFLLALLPGGRSLPDRLSRTHSIAA